MPTLRALPGVLFLLALVGSLPTATAAGTRDRPRTAASARPAEDRLDLNEIINDREIDLRLGAYGGRLIDQGLAVPSRVLRDQLSRTRCAFQPGKPGRRKLSPQEILARSRAGVLVVAGLFQCGKCSQWHAGGGSGAMLSEDGVFATAYHVVASTNHATLVILTGDGRLAPVREVLAANRRADVALLRAEGSGFTPLPLSTNAPVGSPVCVISHPDDHFFTLSQGIVSRYFLQGAGRSRSPHAFMAITADFAKGSSGGPVFNEQGAVVGLVSSTISSYYNEDREHRRDNLQMVFKHCATSRYLLELGREEGP
ncbi:MAG: hypothetical protein RJA22_303 [Verrucomicrobiota bacterium]|jgi:hypothetical protein